MKNKDIGILFEEGVFDILKKRYGNEKESFLMDEKEVFLKDEKGEKFQFLTNGKDLPGILQNFNKHEKIFIQMMGQKRRLRQELLIKI